MKNVKLYGDIAKSEDQDDGTVKVWGYASSNAVDSDGEQITSEAMRAALPEYMRFANVREMHTAKAAGIAIEAEVQEDGRTFFGAHIIDSEAVRKVRAGVYKGFSIGGKVTSRDMVNKSIINGLRLSEVSLVDRPANPEAVFNFFKAEGLDGLDGEEDGRNNDKTKKAEDTTVEAVTISKAESQSGDADNDHSDDLIKAGAKFSGTTKQALGDAHSAMKQACAHLDALAYTGKADEGEDLAKMTSLSDDLAKMTGERDDLAKQLAAYKALPAPTKATLKIVEKSQDVGEALAKSADDDKAKTPESIMKSIHSRGAMVMTASGLRPLI